MPCALVSSPGQSILSGGTYRKLLKKRMLLGKVLAQEGFMTFGYRKDLSGAQSGFVRDKVGVS